MDQVCFSVFFAGGRGYRIGNRGTVVPCRICGVQRAINVARGAEIHAVHGIFRLLKISTDYWALPAKAQCRFGLPQCL